jgi:hypothetical protein
MGGLAAGHCGAPAPSQSPASTSGRFDSPNKTTHLAEAISIQVKATGK